MQLYPLIWPTEDLRVNQARRRLTLIVELMLDKGYLKMGRTTLLKGESGFILLYLAFFDLNLVGGTEAAGN